jgi:hypothetical protein
MFADLLELKMVRMSLYELAFWRKKSPGYARRWSGMLREVGQFLVRGIQQDPLNTGISL